MDTPVDYQARGHAAWLTLNSPANHNALGNALCAGLNEGLDKAANDPNIRVIVLTGMGRSFCAGADLKDGGGGAAGNTPGDAGNTPDAAGNNSEAPGEAPPFVQTMKALWNAPKPVIGRIQGHAFGGGLGLMAACDFAIIADTARFAFTEVRLGLAPAIISVLVLRKVPLAKATPLFLSGTRFGAEEACTLGLGTRAVPPDQLDSAVDALLDELGECGPKALQEVKALLREVPGLSVEAGLEWAAKKNLVQFNSKEAREGMAAFAQKRKPEWAR